MAAQRLGASLAGKAATDDHDPVALPAPSVSIRHPCELEVLA
jgi:hypothetical protein